MRATLTGLLAAGLILGSAAGASAGHESHFGALDVFSFGQLRHGDGHPHFPRNGVFFAPTGFGFASAPPATRPADVFDPILIIAPTFVPAGQPARAVSSGPRIIMIGAELAAGKLPTLIYGIPPLGR